MTLHCKISQILIHLRIQQVSLGPCLVPDSSLYKGKQGLVTLSKLSKNAPTARDHLTRLLTALLLSKGQDRCRKGGRRLSLYQSLRRTPPRLDTSIDQSNPYPRGQGNPLHR